MPASAPLEARVAGLAQRARTATGHALAQHSGRLLNLADSLAHLDPRAVLGRGYAIATTASGTVVRDATSLAPGDALRVAFAHGSAATRVESTAEDR
jgi:exodeoxyribonuclease VII large subunit